MDKHNLKVGETKEVRNESGWIVRGEDVELLNAKFYEARIRANPVVMAGFAYKDYPNFFDCTLRFKMKESALAMKTLIEQTDPMAGNVMVIEIVSKTTWNRVA